MSILHLYLFGILRHLSCIINKTISKVAIVLCAEIEGQL